MEYFLCYQSTTESKSARERQNLSLTDLFPQLPGFLKREGHFHYRLKPHLTLLRVCVCVGECQCANAESSENFLYPPGLKLNTEIQEGETD